MNAKRHLSPSPDCGRGVGERASQLEHAKFLRSNQTEAEQRLWYYLRGHRFMGLKFKRQKPMGPYIADFVCMDCRLVIEADGGQHGGDPDAQRDAWFRAQGFTVLRFWNHEILGQPEAVLERIRQAVTVSCAASGDGMSTNQKAAP
jgi:very-short-patch-repair endonuclease